MTDDTAPRDPALVDELVGMLTETPALIRDVLEALRRTAHVLNARRQLDGMDTPCAARRLDETQNAIRSTSP